MSSIVAKSDGTPEAITGLTDSTTYSIQNISKASMLMIEATSTPADGSKEGLILDYKEYLVFTKTTGKNWYIWSFGSSITAIVNAVR